MVVNISQVLSGDWDYVRADLAAVIEVTHRQGQKVKVIFENCYLNDDQKIRLCEICGALGADWVKTSTGYGTGGATIEDLKLMRQHAPQHAPEKRQRPQRQPVQQPEHRQHQSGTHVSTLSVVSLSWRKHLNRRQGQCAASCSGGSPTGIAAAAAGSAAPWRG